MLTCGCPDDCPQVMSLRSYDDLYYPATLIRKVGRTGGSPAAVKSAAAVAAPAAAASAGAGTAVARTAAIPPPPTADAAAALSSELWEVLYRDGQRDQVNAQYIVHPQRLATEQKVLASRTPRGYPERGIIVGHEDMDGGVRRNAHTVPNPSARVCWRAHCFGAWFSFQAVGGGGR